MSDTWTRAQSEQNAEQNAQEFANRQILLKGSGVPNIQAPIGAEYEDQSVSPALRYRKTGALATDWTEVVLVEVATQSEVDNGLNDLKIVTPATLSNRLDQLAADVLNVPKTDPQQVTNSLDLLASDSANGADFTVTIPPIPTEQVGKVLSLRISGYGTGANLVNLVGAEIGQMVTLKRTEAHALQINTNTNIKLSGVMSMDDPENLDVITLQRITGTLWVELSRTQFL